MNFSTEYVHYLITVKLAGQATKAELQELDHLIATNDAVKQQWEKAIEGISSEDIETRFSKIDNWSWEQIEEIRPKGKGGKIVWTILLAAAVITGIFISIKVIKDAPVSQPSNASQTARTKNIELQLSNGKVFTLSNNSNSQTFEAGTLQNAGKTLTYAVDSTKRGEDVLTAMNVLKVPVGMDYKIVLSDGSQIWLNSQTEVKFPFKFGKTSRELSINGEAYLEVAKDPARPFLVRIGNSTVKVLGTSFNVNTYDSGVIKIALVEGSVRLQTLSTETKITPGYEAIYKNEKVSLKKFDEDMALAWRSGRLYFENATIQEITDVLPRWFGIEVQFDTPGLMADTFTGVVNRNKPITVFLDKLKKIMGIEYYFDKNGVLHIK